MLFTQGRVSVKFGWNRLSVPERIFLNFVNASPSPKDVFSIKFVQILVLWFWRKRFLFYFFYCFFFCFAFSLLSPLWKGRGPTFEQFWIRFNKRMLCAKCGWNFPSGSGEERRRLQRRRGQRANFDLMLSKNLTELKLIITSNYNWISIILN